MGSIIFVPNGFVPVVCAAAALIDEFTHAAATWNVGCLPETGSPKNSIVNLPTTLHNNVCERPLAFNQSPSADALACHTHRDAIAGLVPNDNTPIKTMVDPCIQATSPQASSRHTSDPPTIVRIQSKSKATTKRSKTGMKHLGTRIQFEPSNQRPPRPPNAFILYRREKHSTFKDTDLTNNEISKIVGQMWNLESEEVKNNYRCMAEEHKRVHKQLYPSYKYMPKAKSKRKAKE
ncbi:hypothetical protein HK102_009473 [Quaeritorhiza haematococci]|nr:hypothetical protein HK102_009473 [Quaeritorhiza haematococci]